MPNQPPTCPSCGSPLPNTDARFCRSCGSPLNVAGNTAQLRALLQIDYAGRSDEVVLGARPLTIGRAPDNDIVLAAPFVSAHHARIEPVDHGHLLRDIGSTNGILAGGRRIGELTLQHGSVLRIGDPSTAAFVTLTYRNPALSAAGDAAAARLAFPLDPQDPQITIGRGPCDIMLDDPQVSRFHAQIDRDAHGQLLLRDAGSTNGTFVNGSRLSSPLPLQPGMVIQIGTFRLVYTGTALEQSDQRGALLLEAVNLRRSVTVGKQTITILDDVSLAIAPREFVAIVGGSGTGKSTLLKALCGIAPADSGRVMLNDDDFYANFALYRSILGYVPQDDILHRDLKVERALEFTARLRLPHDTSDAEITARVDRVLNDVEITERRSTVIDALSGGQRKRVSIAAELIADPSLFFLDEPTSGLDPGLEKKLMYTMRQLADAGRTVLMVTHATANITQCDHVIFMGPGGRVVFFGPPAEALRFFGVDSDDFAEIYTKIDGAAAADHPIVARDLADEWRRWQAANPAAARPPLLAELWQQKYRSSAIYNRYVTSRLNTPAAAPARTAPVAPRRHGGLRQLGLLTRRYIEVILQDRRNLALLLLQAPLIALLLILVARPDALIGAGEIDLIPRGEAKKVLFMLATVSVWFGIINAAREITKERPIYLRERLVNLGIGAYIISKMAVLSILLLFQTVVFLAVLAAVVSLPAGTGVLLPVWLELAITLLMTAAAGTALGLLISAASTTADRAVSLVPFALVPQILFAGLIFSLDGAAEPLSWLTVSRWSMDALGTSVDLNSLCNLANTDSDGTVPPGCTPLFLETESAYLHTPLHLISRWAALIITTLVSLALTVVVLLRRERRK
jgi:ABC-type multidrug transport system ATPase subunit